MRNSCGVGLLTAAAVVVGLRPSHRTCWEARGSRSMLLLIHSCCCQYMLLPDTCCCECMLLRMHATSTCCYHVEAEAAPAGRPGSRAPPHRPCPPPPASSARGRPRGAAPPAGTSAAEGGGQGVGLGLGGEVGAGGAPLARRASAHSHSCIPQGQPPSLPPTYPPPPHRPRPRLPLHPHLQVGGVVDGFEEELAPPPLLPPPPAGRRRRGRF